MTEFQDNEILDKIVEHLINSDEKEIWEWFVKASHTELIRDVKNKLDYIGNNSSSRLDLAIMTYIAIGDKEGARLEEYFPQFKGANPKYSFDNSSLIG